MVYKIERPFKWCSFERPFSFDLTRVFLLGLILMVGQPTVTTVLHRNLPATGISYLDVLNLKQLEVNCVVFQNLLKKRLRDVLLCDPFETASRTLWDRRPQITNVYIFFRIC